MATWQDVKQFMYRNYNIESDEGEILTLIFGSDGGRSQLIFLSPVGEYLRIFSPVAAEGQAHPGKVLSGTGLFGATLFAGHYGLVHAQLLATVDDAELTEVLPLIAALADELESELSGGGDAF